MTTTQPTRPADLPAYCKDPVIVLDASHVIRITTFHGEANPGGGELWHRKADGQDGWCAGAFFWRQPAKLSYAVPIWQVVSREPLTLSPSFQCHCGHHGWVENGRWRPA